MAFAQPMGRVTLRGVDTLSKAALNKPAFSHMLVERSGWVAERFKAPVLKTGEVQASVGSNPTPSAK